MSSPSSPGSHRDKVKTILAGRKCYRMSKEKNEVVWPPHLEAALMEGLEQYKPSESKSPRGLTRFPNRNKFIADFIRKKTGEIRSAKQVGSRIQQLRDTSAGKTIMKEISDRHYEMMHPTRPAQTTMDASSLGMRDSFSAGTMLPYMNPVVHVYISVPSASSNANASWATYAQPTTTEVTMLSPAAFQWVEPRTLRTIDPTVAFKSTSPLPLCSSFSVYCGNVPVHVDAPAMMAVREAGEGLFLHYATLAPGYWDTLCTYADLAPYTIIQEISKPSADLGQKPGAVMAIQYHFNTSAAPPLSPFTLTEDDLEVDYETDEMLPPHTAHALSTCSESPYPSDRSSSPSYSIPGFASQPLSPIEWVPTNNWAFAQAFPASQTQAQTQGQVGAYYQHQHHQQQQTHQTRGYVGPF